MAGLAARLRTSKLPPEVNRILFVKNLPFKITSEEVYDIFGKYGAIRQVRVGNATETRGTAFVVYEDIFDAKNACEHLSGFNVGGRYLSVLYYQVNKGQAAKGAGTLAQQEAEVAALRARVAAGEAAGGGAEDSLDDDADKKLMKR